MDTVNLIYGIIVTISALWSSLVIKKSQKKMYKFWVIIPSFLITGASILL